MDLQATVLNVLAEIAPEADLATLEPDAPFAEQLDLDSMDFHAIVAALHDELEIDVPERDYPKLSTLDGAVAYLAARAA